jgi:dihydropteroate synthase
VTVCALLEPVLGLAEPIQPILEAAETLWMVRLNSWQERWGQPPSGMDLVSIDKRTHCAGRLPRSQLDGWIEGLIQAGHKQPASSLVNSLQGHTAKKSTLKWGSAQAQLDLSQPQVMGIINISKDSFSGDGTTVEQAINQGLAMAEQGAAILDIGGESTRPGAARVTVDQELALVVPVVKALASQLSIPISIDSSKPEVMAASLKAGAAIINDVTALHGLGDKKQAKESLALLAESDCPIILMHMQGEPATMQREPHYQHVMAEVYGFLAERIDYCLANGIKKERIIVDPGIGFGKTAEHNLELMRRQRTLRGLGVPILLGLSRKRIVGKLSGEDRPEQRDRASNLLAAFGYMAGADIFRVHDVQGACEALAITKGWLHKSRNGS